MSRLGRLRTSYHPSKNILVDRLDRDVVFRRSILDRVNRRRRDRGHRKICVAHPYPVDRSLVGKRRLITCVVSKRVVSPMPVDVTVDRRDRFRLGLIKIVVVDLVIADARADREPCVRDRLPIPCESDLNVADIAVGEERKDLLHLDRFDSTGLRPGDLILENKLYRPRLTTREIYRITFYPEYLVVLLVQDEINKVRVSR